MTGESVLGVACTVVRSVLELAGVSGLGFGWLSSGAGRGFRAISGVLPRGAADIIVSSGTVWISGANSESLR